MGLPDDERGGPGGGGIGLPVRDIGAFGGWPGWPGEDFFGSASIGGRPFASVPAPSVRSGFGVTVGGGATGPSGIARRESFEETTFFGIAMSGSTSASSVMVGTALTGSAVGAGSGAGAGSTGAAASTGSATSGCTGAGASATGSGAGSGAGAGAGGSSADGLEAAFFGGFFEETGAFFSVGAFSSGASSSGGVSRISPSRSALRRTRSACASTTLEE